MTGLADWLEARGLAKHAKLFAENDIELDVLPELTEADLRELGLSLGDRKRLLAAVRTLANTVEVAVVSTPAPEPTPSPTTADARRQVTVLFADLSGFTTLSTRIDAEEVHALLQRYFEVVDEIVRGFGGSIDKHIGDAVMAVFGAPVAHTDDPERAVRAGLEIHRQLAEFAPPLIAHVGIASGQVVASRTGSAAFDEYTVTGASVNLAARLQDLADPGETLVSDAVRNAVTNTVTCESAGDADVKGFEAPIKTWRVLSVADQNIREGSRPFVGRRHELEQLRGVMNLRLESRSGQAVLLRGEPGIGKTRLLDQFQSEAEGKGFQCHAGLVLDFGAGKGRDAIPAMVRGLIGIPPGSRKPVRRLAADKAIADGLVRPENAVHLNSLLDLPQPPELAEMHDAMDHQTRTRGLSRTVASLAHEIGRRRPTLLRIEDIHWADPVLLDQLAALAASIVSGTVVVVMTTRTEGDPVDAAWRAKILGCPLTTIDLGPLGQADAAELARQYLETNQKLAEACIARAAGNPLFLDQLLRNAEENAEHGVPGSVQSIVQTRVDNLDPTDRLAIHASAVLGQRFTADAVGFMIGAQGYDCAGLVAHQLVRPEGDGFLFVHALVRDGVYGTLLTSDRHGLHLKAADWFSGHDSALHARHLEAAEHRDASVAYVAASREEAGAYRYDRALTLAEAAVRLARDRMARFAALCLTGELLRLLADSALSINCYERALVDAEEPTEEIHCRLGLAAGMRILDRFDEAFEQLDKAETLSRESNDLDRMAEIEFMRGNLCFPLGRTEECVAAHDRALEFARRAGNEEFEVQALGGLADAYYAQSRIASARAHFEECVNRAATAGFARIAVANAPMLGWTSILTGDYVGSVPILNQARTAAENAGNDRAKIIVMNGLSLVALDQGDLDLAETHAREINRLSERLSSDRFLSYGLNMLALAEFARDDITSARQTIDRALKAAEGSAIGFCGPWICGTAARLSDSPQQARGFLDTGEALLDAGAVAHNHYFFRREALACCLDLADWDGVDHHAAAFAAYLDTEPTQWTKFFIQRARAFAARRQGQGDATMERDLRDCLLFAEQQKLAPFAEEIRAVLGDPPARFIAPST